jgi:hypothetical protein
MSTKFLTLILIAAASSAPLYALTADNYLASGRDSLFSGTISGIRQAHATFEQAMNDASCPDCRDNRELLFFHALSRIAMWAARQDGAPVDSLLEACEAIDAPVLGDDIRGLIFTEPVVEEDRYGRPVLPRNAEQMLVDLLSFIDASALPELDATIAQLDRITETADNRFRVFLTPAETGVFLDWGEPLYTYDVEVDYAEVMMLKGILHMLKGFITAQSAWDFSVSDPEALYYRHWENCFSLQNDLLLPNPEFLRLLPTANDPSDGAAILLEARQGILTALQYYLDVIAYIQNEDIPAGTDPQDDELFSIDPDDTCVADQVVELITSLMDSLIADTPFAAPGVTMTDYHFDTPDGKGVSFSIEWEPLGSPQVDWFNFRDATNFCFFDDVDLTYIDDQIYCTMEGYVHPLGYIYGYFSGTLSPGRSMIFEPFFEYYGNSSAVYDDLAMNWSDQRIQDPYTIDVNPALGGTPRYPQPVSPRGLLFEFGPWNKPMAGTLPDPTLGGILPEATDRDWTRWVNPQPAGNIPWPLIQSWQLYNRMYTGDRWPAFWLDEQRVFADVTGELDTSEEAFDFSELYLGLDWNALYGSVVMAGDFSPDETTLLQLFLSYSPEEEESAGAVMIELTIGGESSHGRLYYRIEDSGHWWADYGTFDIIQFAGEVDFRIPLDLVPAGLAGRFLTIVSARRDPHYWSTDSLDENYTHLQLGPTGTIKGTVTYPGWLGGPIIVQAFSEPDEPEDSLLAYTVLDAPGDYTLEGIGMGWTGYVRAISPLFGPYHPFDMDAIKAECILPVTLRTQTVSQVDLNLQVPTVLPHVYSFTHFDSLNTTTNRRDVYAFDAIAGGYYYLKLSAEFEVRLILMDRNGSDTLVELYPWQAQEIAWLCPVNGRYYVEVSENGWWRYGGDYNLTFGTSWSCPPADISSAQWSGVKDCRVDLADFALLAGQWLADCGDPYWCAESDYDRSGAVDLADFVQLIEQWLEEGGDTI